MTRHFPFFVKRNFCQCQMKGVVSVKKRVICRNLQIVEFAKKNLVDGLYVTSLAHKVFTHDVQVVEELAESRLNQVRLSF